MASPRFICDFARGYFELSSRIFETAAACLFSHAQIPLSHPEKLNQFERFVALSVCTLLLALFFPTPVPRLYFVATTNSRSEGYPIQARRECDSVLLPRL